MQGYGAPSIFFYGISIQSGVTEVRSKILTPLETTGGNSFSLEGFEKIDFTQGDFHSTGRIQISFLGGL